MVEKVGGGGGGISSGSVSTAKMLTPIALQDIAAIPGVIQVIPRDYLNGQGMIKAGKLETWANMMGVATDSLENLGYPLSEGTLEIRKGTAIIGSWVSRNFYDPNMRPGQDPPEPPDLMNQRIKLELIKWTNDGVEVKKTVTLEVTGVLQEARNEADGSIFVSMEDLTTWNEWFNGKRINRNKDGYSNVIVKAESPEVVMGVTDSINELGFMAYSPQSTVQGINSFFVVLQLIFGGIGAIALLVAAIGIANTMTMAILERTREIGLMKAVGATNRDVLSIFLGEAAGIGFLGGLGGILLGWGGSKVLNILALQYLSGQSQNGNDPDKLYDGNSTLAAVICNRVCHTGWFFFRVVSGIKGSYTRTGHGFKIRISFSAAIPPGLYLSGIVFALSSGRYKTVKLINLESLKKVSMKSKKR